MNNKILFSIVTIACLVGSTPAIAARKSTPAVSYLSRLNSAIATSPESYVLYHNRAAYYMSVHNYAKALVDMNKAVALSSQDSEMLQSRAKLFIAMKNYQKALSDLNVVVAAKPGDSEQRFVRTTVLIKLKQYENALADLNIILRTNPRVGYAYAARGSVYMGLQQFTKALADYNAALLCNYQNTDMLSDMYKEYAKEKKYELALSPLNRLIAATKKTPSKVTLYRERLDLYAKLEHCDPNLVANDLLKIGDLEPENVDVHMQFATSQWQRQPFLALQALNQVLKIQPNNPTALSLRARLQVQHNLDGEAIQDCTKAIELDPRAAINFATRSEAHLSQKQYNETIADANSAIALQPDLADAYYLEGAAYQALQRNQEALAALNHYLQLKPKEAVQNDDDAARVEEANRRVKFVEGSLATVERQNAVRAQNELKGH
jgi:tetratricopeptide (TPR) repeat protein